MTQGNAVPGRGGAWDEPWNAVRYRESKIRCLRDPVGKSDQERPPRPNKEDRQPQSTQVGAEDVLTGPLGLLYPPAPPGGTYWEGW